MNVIEARAAWLQTRHQGYCCNPDEDDLLDAFAAGWNAARPAIRGTTAGTVSHNSAKVPGELQVTLWGHTADGQEIALVMGEAAVVALQANLTRMGVGL